VRTRASVRYLESFLTAWTDTSARVYCTHDHRHNSAFVSLWSTPCCCCLQLTITAAYVLLWLPIALFTVTDNQHRFARRGLTLLLLTVLVIAEHSCTTVASDTADRGISPQEASILGQYFYYSPEYALPVYTREQLGQRLRRSADPTLDGKYAESQKSSIAIALASVGDDRFADVLWRESDDVQRAVYRDISPLWTDFGLQYPKTEALLHKFGEQNQPL
jgi:hypothetical protein